MIIACSEDMFESSCQTNLTNTSKSQAQHLKSSQQGFSRQSRHLVLIWIQKLRVTVDVEPCHQLLFAMLRRTIQTLTRTAIKSYEVRAMLEMASTVDALRP